MTLLCTPWRAHPSPSAWRAVCGTSLEVKQPSLKPSIIYTSLLCGVQRLPVKRLVLYCAALLCCVLHAVVHWRPFTFDNKNILYLCVYSGPSCHLSCVHNRGRFLGLWCFFSLSPALSRIVHRSAQHCPTPWVLLSNTPAQCDVQRMNGCWARESQDRHLCRDSSNSSGKRDRMNYG